jgi:hypothetical protein
MYDNPVCKAGGFCVVVAGLSITGWWLALALFLLLVVVVAGARYFYRLGQGESVTPRQWYRNRHGREE